MTEDKPSRYMYLVFLTLFFPAALSCTSNAQQTDQKIIAALNQRLQQAYGPDQHLINGVEYINLHLRSEGHKFLDEDEYYPGRVVIDSKTYRDVSLKYDIFNQQVLLLVPHPSGGHKQIILNNQRLDEFEINGRIFQKRTFPGQGTRFYQVIGNDEMACLFHFSKQEVPRPVDNYTLSEFTEQKKRSYLYWQSQQHAFKGKRSFVRIFPNHQPEIKAFIREHKLQVKELSDPQIHELIHFCQSLNGSSAENP